MTKKINVYIITGFLGSGKTTVLNNLLSQFSTEKNVVIENEFGKINIDATLVNGTFESVYELTNGCICCSINNQLLETLSQIHNLEEKPQNLFIETTGIADVGEVGSVFKSLYIENSFHLKKIICVVDAENLENYIDSNIEIQRQIVNSDCIIINKTKSIDYDDIIDIKKNIKTINRFAKIVLSKDGSLDSKYLFSPNKQVINPVTTDYKFENGHKIKTILFETDDFFDINMLKYELFKNLYLYYHQIFRIKGYVVNVDNQVFLVQSVGKSSTVLPVENIKIEKSQLVFIGRALELKSIERLLKRAIAKKGKRQSS
jgi:G3E family GTPase